MREIIEIERRETKLDLSSRFLPYVAFHFIVHFVNGDSAAYVLVYHTNSRQFETGVRIGHRPKDPVGLARRKSAGLIPFKIKGRLADHLKTLLTAEELARCASLSFGR